MTAVWLKISVFIISISFSWTLIAGPPKMAKPIQQQVPKPIQRQVPQLTKKEKAFVKKAKATFKSAAHEPPPTVHMMDKMQSGVPQ